MGDDENVFPEEIRANRLTLGIYPEERISLTFQTKNYGAMLRLWPVTMDFIYRQCYAGPGLDAYRVRVGKRGRFVVPLSGGSTTLGMH
jgi:glucose-6-phosphate 1-dehydrogenase